MASPVQVQGGGKQWKAIKAQSAGGRRQPVPPPVLTYCLSFKCFCEDGYCTHGTENMLHFACSDLLRFFEYLQDHGIILEF